MMKNKYIIANWKMNMDLRAITQWLEKFYEVLPEIPPTKTVILAPSFPYLGILATELKNQKLKLSAQDLSIFSKGAHTGSTGSFQLKDFCEYCIIGHSELKEPIEISLQKREISHKENITPIFCFAKLEDAKRLYDEKTLIVWEDPDTISINGVSRAKATYKIEEDINTLRDIVLDKCTIIYGGSINKDNIKELSTIKELDGVLVGSASLDPTHFAELIVQF